MEFLAGRRPAGGAAADFGAGEGFFGLGAATTVGPAVVEKPCFGDRDVEIGGDQVAAAGDGVEGEAGNGAAFAPEGLYLGGAEGAGGLGGVNRGSPEDFVGHPVADAGETFLHEEDGFDGRAGAALKERGDGGGGEGG